MKCKIGRKQFWIILRLKLLCSCRYRAQSTACLSIGRFGSPDDLHCLFSNVNATSSSILMKVFITQRISFIVTAKGAQAPTPPPPPPPPPTDIFTVGQKSMRDFVYVCEKYGILGKSFWYVRKDFGMFANWYCAPPPPQTRLGSYAHVFNRNQRCMYILIKY